MIFSDLVVRLFYFTSFLRSEETAGHFSMSRAESWICHLIQEGQGNPAMSIKKDESFRVFVNERVPGIWSCLWSGFCPCHSGESGNYLSPERSIM